MAVCFPVKGVVPDGSDKDLQFHVFLLNIHPQTLVLSNVKSNFKIFFNLNIHLDIRNEEHASPAFISGVVC